MNHQPLPQRFQRFQPGRRFTRSLVTAGAIALIATSCGADASESASAKIDSDVPATAPATAPPASTNVETSTTTTSEPPAATAPSASTNPEISTTTTTEPSIAGAVLIESTAVFSGGQVVGTFEVPEGADVLGCTAGSFVDTELPAFIRRVMTCESGDRSGTITVHFVLGDDPGAGDLNGPWNVESGTEGFVGLQGEGDFSVTFQPESGTGAETFSGEIRYGPPNQAD